MTCATGGRLLRLLLPLAAGIGASPSLAQTSNLSAVDVFARAEEARQAGRNEEALLLYRALQHDPDPDIRAEARFREGMTLAETRHYAAAAAAFRAVLDEKPDAVRVRLELARVLALMGEDAAARRMLRQAQAAGLPDDVAVVVDQFARVLRSARPFGGSLQVSVAPDSNINRATQARTLDTVIAPLTLSRDARARSGLGLRVSGQGFARIPIADQLALVPRVSMLGNLYQQDRFNDVSGSGLIGLEWRRGNDRWSPSIGATQRWYGGSVYARTGSVVLDWLHPLGRQAQLLAHAGAAISDYRRNDLQDGGLFDLSLSYDRALTARAGFGIGLAGYRQSARDRGYATVAGGPSASAWRDLGKTTIFVSTAVSRLEGDARLFLFPKPRREWLAISSVGATFRQLRVRGFAPLVRLSLERNWSSVGIYRYRRVLTEFGLTRAF